MRMPNKLASTIFLALLSAGACRAEFKHVEMSVYGMD